VNEEYGDVYPVEVQWRRPRRVTAADLQKRIALLPGDGIGPEIGAAATRVLGALGDFEIAEHPIGGASIDAHGTALTDDVLAACRASDAVLLCAVGGPKWDTTDPEAPRPEQGLLVDKANVLETSRLWRETVSRLAPEYGGIELDHLLVDNAAMQLVSRPADFDVIVTENLFGDILSDEAAMLTGSLGMLPSASLGEKGPGLFEPVHGSAPDIADKGIANPLATFLSVAMMLRYGLGRHQEADRVDAAVDKALADGLRTPDLAAGEGTREVGTEEMTDAVLAALA